MKLRFALGRAGWTWLLVSGCLLATLACAPLPPEHDGGAPAHPLVGKPAPEIQGALVDESSFQLSEQTARGVVMLDFWATWCGPCIMELPVLMKVADEFRDRGVSFYAVNIMEDRATVNKCLEDYGWKLNVVMDPEGKHATAYGVDPIPHLVIIGKGGVIRQVHIGMAPDFENTLRKELNEAIAAEPKP